MVRRLIPQVGFGWTMRICAFMILGLMVFSNLTVTSRIPPSKRPLSLSAFTQPLKERTFILTAAASFFFYCESRYTYTEIDFWYISLLMIIFV